MEYVYSALLLHDAEKEINEDNVKKVLTAAGAKVDDARVKALVASLDGVNIEEAVKSAAPVAVAAAPAHGAGSAHAAKAEEKKEENEEKKEEEAAAGLSALFG